MTPDGRPRRKFGRKKEAAIAALLTARNNEEAAKAVGVSPKTLSPWQKLPGFERAFREARMAAFRRSTARLQQASCPAVTTLLKIMVDPAAPMAVKARCAYYVLDQTRKAIETEDIEARLTELARALGTAETGRADVRAIANEDSVAERLEEVQGIGDLPQVEFQTGDLKELPREYTGDRHIVTVGRDLDGTYHREERPAPEHNEGKANSKPPFRVVVASPEDGPSVPGV